MKLCKDCKFYWDDIFSTCKHEKAKDGPQYLVDGYQQYFSCYIMRQATKACGIEGKLFQPSFLHRIFHLRQTSK